MKLVRKVSGILICIAILISNTSASYFKEPLAVSSTVIAEDTKDSIELDTLNSEMDKMIEDYKYIVIQLEKNKSSNKTTTSNDKQTQKIVKGNDFRAKFINKMAPYAKTAEEKTGINFEFILAHWAHESGYGTSNRAVNHNNYAGIAVYSSSSKGGRYNSIDDFVNAYSKLMNNKRYAKVKSATNVTSFALLLKQSGYAADDNYQNHSVWKEVVNLVS